MRAVALCSFALLAGAACSGGGDIDIGGEIWVANAASDDVRVYDGRTSERLATIELPDQTPHALELSPDGDEVWVVNIEGFSVWVIDVATREVTHRIEGDDLVESPATLRFSADGATAFVVGGEGYLTVIDTATYEPTSIGIAGYGPHGLWVMPDGTLRTANRGSNDVSTFDAAGTFIDHFPAGAFPYDVVADADGTVLYVSARQWDAVSVLRAEDHHLLGAVPVGDEPVIQTIADGGRTLFVANTGLEDSTVTMIDLPTLQVLGRGRVSIGDVVDIGSQVGDCAGCVVPVVGRWDGHVVAGEVTRIGSAGVVLETADGDLTVPENVFLGLKGGLAPHGVTSTPDGHYVLVAFNASDDVFIYDAATGDQVRWLHGCETAPSATEPGCNPGVNDVEVVPS